MFDQDLQSTILLSLKIFRPLTSIHTIPVKSKLVYYLGEKSSSKFEGSDKNLKVQHSSIRHHSAHCFSNKESEILPRVFAYFTMQMKRVLCKDGKSNTNLMKTN